MTLPGDLPLPPLDDNLAAPDLVGHLAAVQHVLKGLMDRVNITDQVLRRIRMLGLAVGVMFALGLLVAANQLVIQRRQQVQVCNSQNSLRTGNRILWGNVLDRTPPPTLPPNPTQAQIEAQQRSIAITDQFKRDLHTYFDPIDC